MFYKVKQFKWGYVGELIANIEPAYVKIYHLVGSDFDLFFKIQNDEVINRTKYYYSESLVECFFVRESAFKVFNMIISSSGVIDNYKRFVLLTLLQYILCMDCKIIDVMIRMHYYDKYMFVKNEIMYVCERMVSVIFGDEIYETAIIPFFDKKTCVFSAKTRKNIEMDNILIIIIDYFMFRDRIIHYDCFVSIMLGGSFIAPMYVALIKFFENKKIEFDYIKASRYDNNKCQEEIFLNKTIKELNTEKRLLILDDNVGSGKTLLFVKQCFVEQGFNYIDLKAVEYHWEKYFRKNVQEEDIFCISSLKFVSPIIYRHYRDSERYIDSILENKDFKSKQYFPKSISDVVKICTYKRKLPIYYFNIIERYRCKLLSLKTELTKSE